MENLTFTMPDDKAAQIIIGKSGPDFIIMDRKIPGEKTVIRKDRFHEVQEFDTLEEAYEFCQTYDPEYAGNYLFGDLDLEEVFVANEEASAPTARVGEPLTINSGLTVAEDHTVTFTYLHNDEVVTVNTSEFTIDSVKPTDEGILNVIVRVYGDHNRSQEFMREVEIVLEA